jgi:hypothetical protein
MRPSFRAELRNDLVDSWRSIDSIQQASIHPTTGSTGNPLRRRRQRWPLIGGLVAAGVLVAGISVLSRRQSSLTTTAPIIDESSVESVGQTGTVGATDTSVTAQEITVTNVEPTGRQASLLLGEPVFAATGNEVIHAGLNPAGVPYVLAFDISSDQPQPARVRILDVDFASGFGFPNKPPDGIASESIKGIVVGPWNVLYLDVQTEQGERSIVAYVQGSLNYDKVIARTSVPAEADGGPASAQPMVALLDGVGFGDTTYAEWVGPGGDPTTGQLPQSAAWTTQGPERDLTVALAIRDGDTHRWGLAFGEEIVDVARAFPGAEGTVVAMVVTHRLDNPSLRSFSIVRLAADGTSALWGASQLIDPLPVGVSGSTAYYLDGPLGERTLRSVELGSIALPGDERPNTLTIDRGSPAEAMVLQRFTTLPAESFDALGADWLSVVASGFAVKNTTTGSTQVFDIDGELQPNPPSPSEGEPPFSMADDAAQIGGDYKLFYTSKFGEASWLIQVRDDSGGAIDAGRAYPAPRGTIAFVPWSDPAPVADNGSVEAVAILGRSNDWQRWNLPEGWRLVASNQFGILAGRIAPGSSGDMELAWIVRPDQPAPTVAFEELLVYPSDVTMAPSDSGIGTPGILPDGSLVLPSLDEAKLVLVNPDGTEQRIVELPGVPASVAIGPGNVARIWPMDSSGPYYVDLRPGSTGVIGEGGVTWDSSVGKAGSGGSPWRVPMGVDIAKVGVVSRQEGADAIVGLSAPGGVASDCEIRLSGSDWIDESQLFDQTVAAIVGRQRNPYTSNFEIVICSGSQMTTAAVPGFAWALTADGLLVLSGIDGGGVKLSRLAW